MIFIGIDPGVTGSIAAINQEGSVLLLEDYPGDEPRAFGIIRDFMEGMFSLSVPYDEKVTAAIEDVHLIPGWGAKGGALMENKGVWKGLLTSFLIPIREVKPKKWQAGLFKRTDGSKSVKKKEKETGKMTSKVIVDTQKAGLAVARRMFPEAEIPLKKHHNRAAALLIANWLRSQFVGG